MAIPFKQDFSMPVGECVSIGDGLARVLAPNPSPFTYTGTQTYLLGTDSLTILDPGPPMDAHLDALLGAIGDRRVDQILVTHTHMDHSPLAMPLKEKTGAPVYGFGPHGSGQKGWSKGGLDSEKVEAGADKDFAPDHLLEDGDIVTVDGGSLKAVHTPGHTSNHLCFLWEEQKTLFSGDHIMGWSTTVIAPPDGNMTAYIGHLESLLTMEIERLVPTHGPVIDDAQTFIKALIDHRLDREQQVISALESGQTQIGSMVELLYKDVDKMLHPAAARSMLAHLIKLVDEGRVTADSDPSLTANFTLQ